MQLTQREFLFLEDTIAGEQIGIMQFQDLAQHCTDPQLREICQQIAQQNMQHFNRLVRILHQGQGGQSNYNVEANQATLPGWGGFTGSNFSQ